MKINSVTFDAKAFEYFLPAFRDISNFITSLDNSCCEQISAKKRTVYVPRSNIGVSRLPLPNVPKITEYEDSTDDCSITNVALRRYMLGRTFVTKKFMSKPRFNRIRRKENLCCCSIDSTPNANLSVRLRGGTDFFRMPLKARRINNNNKCRIFQSTCNQKPMTLREQSGIIYRNLQKSVNGKEKNTLTRQTASFQKEKESIEQSKTLKGLGKLTILLLYLHFLLSYYLSFSKTQHFEEFFEICETETRYE